MKGNCMKKVLLGQILVTLMFLGIFCFWRMRFYVPQEIQLKVKVKLVNESTRPTSITDRKHQLDLIYNESEIIRSYNVPKPEVFTLQDQNITYYRRVSENITCFLPGSDLTNASEACVCRDKWTADDCSIPKSVSASLEFQDWNKREMISKRSKPRRVINMLPFLHEFDMLEIRMHEIGDLVELFVIGEGIYTGYGRRKPLYLYEKLQKGFLKEYRNKILYIYIDTFPKEGYNDGWVADTFFRNELWTRAQKYIVGLRPDDLFVLNDADEIPSYETIAFLKTHNGYGHSVGLRLRWFVYGFFWVVNHQYTTTYSVCSMKFLRDVVNNDAMAVRRNRLSDFRSDKTDEFIFPWVIGNEEHIGGWHCSWCFDPKGMRMKLMSAQKDDGLRYGDFPEKLNLTYLQSLRSKGMWLDDVGKYAPFDTKSSELPTYVLENSKKFEHLLNNTHL